jgi:hypothetical protein
MQLNVDTSFWTRYRSDANNPDLDPNFVFAQAVNPSGGIKNRTAIPRNNADTAGSAIGNPTDHLKAIAFTAGFHFAFIEQGGTSLYPSLAQRVTDPEVSCSASVQPRPCTFRPGRIRREMRLR